MAIAAMSFPHLLAPFHALWVWATRPRIPVRPHPAAAVTAAARVRAVAPPPAGPQRPTPRRPLRVVRVVDAQHARDGAGRMVISGRLADVCAELDRLAAREAQAAGTPPTR